MNRPAANTPSHGTARSYQQLLTKLLRHGAYAQLRKVIDKTMAADLGPVLPLLLEDDPKRILSLLIEAGKAARSLLRLDDNELDDLVGELDDATLAPISPPSPPDDAPARPHALDHDR